MVETLEQSETVVVIAVRRWWYWFARFIGVDAQFCGRCKSRLWLQRTCAVEMGCRCCGLKYTRPEFYEFWFAYFSTGEFTLRALSSEVGFKDLAISCPVCSFSVKERCGIKCDCGHEWHLNGAGGISAEVEFTGD